MKNYIQPGKSLSYAHNAAVTPGTALLIGVILGIASSSYAANEQGEYRLDGVYELPAEAAAAGGVGDNAYWDAAKARITSTANGNVVVGVYFAAKAAAATVAMVRLNGTAA